MATAQDIIDLVRPLLNDSVAPVRYTDAELTRWISDAQREIVRLKPESNVATALFGVANPSAYQELGPDVAYALVRVEANGYAGTPAAVGAELLASYKPAVQNISVATATFTISVPAGTNRVLVGEFVVGNLTSITSLNHTVTVDGVAASAKLTREDVGAEQMVAMSIITAALGTSAVDQTMDVVITFNNPGLALRSVSFQGNAFINVVQADATTWFDSDAAAFAGTFQPVSTVAVGAGDLVFTGIGFYDTGTPAFNTAPAVGFTPNLTTNAGNATLATAYATGVTGIQTLTWVQSGGTGNPTFGHADVIVLRGIAVDAGDPTWGNIVRRVDRYTLDSMHPAWTYEYPAPAPDVGTYFKEWSLDPHIQRAFYLYPAPDPLAAFAYDVFVTYVAVPPELLTVASILTLSDMYHYPIVNYVMHRALGDQTQGYSEIGSRAAIGRFAADLQIDRAELKKFLGMPARIDGETK